MLLYRYVALFVTASKLINCISELFIYSLFRILDKWVFMRKNYFNTTAWVDWLNSWIPKLPYVYTDFYFAIIQMLIILLMSHNRFFEEEVDLRHTMEEALTIELLMHDNEHGYFAGTINFLNLRYFI